MEMLSAGERVAAMQVEEWRQKLSKREMDGRRASVLSP